ncbi:hypothetical protein BR63_17345 [Thermanaerosceptrum fracticalcis]|uniref:Response regulatory domain-containing protein n=1 Tax=Thermanaerosceptrum fracticalcis TaxID=1712410 RepID=A0A7G6E713_THEFR|nr:response regulator [Thermanaerosceptrum fracticalcis]QNB47867.1 hypothetical protein BR63_17345 [Thermanaerosceptrum fracticalcis]
MNAFKGKRILIVEDSRFLAQITANTMIKYGYMTEIAQLNWHCSFMKQMPMQTCTGRYLKIH